MSSSLLPGGGKMALNLLLHYPQVLLVLRHAHQLLGRGGFQQRHPMLVVQQEDAEACPHGEQLQNGPSGDLVLQLPVSQPPSEMPRTLDDLVHGGAPLVAPSRGIPPCRRPAVEII